MKTWPRTLLFIIIFHSTACSNHDLDGTQIMISPKINQDYYYVMAHAFLFSDSIQLGYLTQCHYRFDSTRMDGFSTYLFGEMSMTGPDLYSDQMDNISVKLNEDGDYIYLEFIDDYGLCLDALLKSAADTTKIPTPDFNQFPLTPKTLITGNTFQVVRPGDDFDQFVPVERHFTILERTKIQARDRFYDGIKVLTDHYIHHLHIRFKSLYNQDGKLLSVTEYPDYQYVYEFGPTRISTIVDSFLTQIWVNKVPGPVNLDSLMNNSPIDFFARL